MTTEAPCKLAFSYTRFSTKEQEGGDSLERQMRLTRAYCERNGLVLDDSLNLRDLGVSAFRGKNVSEGAKLGAFIEACRTGRVPRGSTLIVENVDRLSRQGIDEGYDLCKQILKLGIYLVTLTPERRFDIEATKSLTKGALELQIILERAHEESDRKSGFRASAWKAARQAAKEGKGPMLKMCPGWLEVVGDGDKMKFKVKPGAAA